LKRIDKAAKKAAKTSTYVDRGFRPGTLARSLVHGVAAMFPASGKTAVIRPYRKQIVLRGENKVRFDLLDESTGKFTNSHFAYTTPELAAELHRGNGYRVEFNSNPKYPKIITIAEKVTLRSKETTR
jgi:hypothetical protein